MQSQKYTQLIKDTAKKLGFQSCGISKARFLAEEEARLSQWLSQKKQGEMAYMENHFDKRLDPTKLVEGSNSVISLLLNYYPSESQTENAPKISKYAYGEDYHLVIKDKLKLLVESMKEEIGDIQGRVFVDSAPVMDKAWAKKAGLGWLGKNTNLIHPKEGSFFFIAEIISDLSFTQDPPMRDYCGTCSKCLDACPTNALATPYQIDASRCISYLTIELKDQLIPQQFNESMENWMFGCDICQDVCPWNRFSKAHKEARFNPDFELLNLNTNDWHALTSDHFEILFKNSAIKRTGFQGLKRNINFLKPIEKP